jgi:hypothetical protein
MHFHTLERGCVWVEFEGQKTPISLAPGDVLVIAQQQRYPLVDLPGRKSALRRSPCQLATSPSRRSTRHSSDSFENRRGNFAERENEYLHYSAVE